MLTLDGPSMRDPKTAKAQTIAPAADTASSMAATKPAAGPKQAFVGQPRNACLDSFVFAEFLSKTGKATFGNSA